MSVVCNVSGGIDVRNARPAILVDFDPVRDPRAGRPQEIDIGVDTDPGDYEVAFKLPARPGHDALDSPAALDPLDAITQLELNSMRSMECGDDTAHLEPEHACQRGRPRVDCGHIDSKHAQRRRHFAADETETDHDGSGSGASRSLDSLGVFHRAEVEDAFPLCAWEPQVTLAPTGGEESPVVRNDLVAVEANPLGVRFELDGRPAEQEFDSEALVCLAGRHERVFKRLAAAQKPFGKRGALIGQMRLSADQGHVSIRGAAAHFERRVGAGQACPNDYDRQGVSHAPADRSECWRRSVERSRMTRARR